MLVLLAAAALTVATADYADAAVIAVVVLVNTALSVRQAVGADRALAALDALAAPTSVVRRDGHREVVAASELVPADDSVLEAVALRVDESSLTGESVPVDKVAGASRLLAGTAVLHGRATASVDATGADSAVGQIAGLLRGRPPRTPLERSTARLSAQLAAVAVVLSAAVLALGLLQGQDLELMLVTAASLVVAAVPSRCRPW